MSNTTKVITITMLTMTLIFSPLGAFAFPNQGNFLELKKAVIDINDEVITDVYL